MNSREAEVRRLLESVRARYSTPKGLAHYEWGARTLGLCEWEKAMIRLYLMPPASVLDVGCGAGRVALALARQGYAVTGIDITPELLAIARRLAEEFQLDLTFKQCNGLTLEFADRSFHYVLLHQMLSHVPLRANRVGLLHACARVVSGKGRIVLTYDDYRAVESRRLWGSDRPPDPRAQQAAAPYSVLEPGDVLDNPRRGPNDEDPVFGYVHRYTCEGVESEVLEAGLKIVEHISVATLPEGADPESPGYIVVADRS